MLLLQWTVSREILNWSKCWEEEIEYSVLLRTKQDTCINPTAIRAQDTVHERWKESKEWKGAAKCSLSNMLWLSPSLSNSLFSWIWPTQEQTQSQPILKIHSTSSRSLFSATLIRSSYSSVTNDKVPSNQPPQFLFPPKNWLLALMMRACWQQISKDEGFWNIHSAYTGLHLHYEPLQL